VINQFSVANVSVDETIEDEENLVEIDEVGIDVMTEDEEEILNSEKKECMKQSVTNAETIVNFHSDLQAINLSTAVIAL